MKTLDYIKKLNGKKFFILDTGKNPHDANYKEYCYSKHKFNRLTIGSIFIYRVSKEASENNKFYFFGGGWLAN